MDSNQRYQDLVHLLDLSPQSHKTCIGSTKSTKKQCGCAVALKSRNEVIQILSTMAADVITIESAKQSMEVVAKLLLCRRYHQDQSASLVTLWIGKLQSSYLTSRPVMETGREEQYLQQEDTDTDTDTEPEPEPRVILDHPRTSAQAGERLHRTAASTTQRRRAPDRPLPMAIRSAARATRESHRKCPICWEVYDLKDNTIFLCVDCHNIYHHNCGEEWIREHDTCPLW